MDSNGSVPALTDDLLNRAKILAQLVTIAWAVFMLDNLLFAENIKQLGIRPRKLSGLLGIPLWAFLHADFNHLMGNTSFFLILGGVLMLRGVGDFIVVSLVALLVGGFGTWLFAGGNNHIGASGVLFGYLGFLLLRGYFETSIFSALVTILGGTLYARYLWGIFPTHPTISWEGHFFGFASGILTARVLEAIKANLPTGLF